MVRASSSSTPNGRAVCSWSLSNIRKLLQTRWLFGVLALLWAALTFWLSSSPDAQGVGGFLDLRPPFDKLYHAVNFGVLAALLYLATGRAWLAVLLASLYGVSDELHQSFVPGRSSDVTDWLADTAGAFLAVLVVRYVLRCWVKGKASTR